MSASRQDPHVPAWGEAGADSRIQEVPGPPGRKGLPRRRSAERVTARHPGKKFPEEFERKAPRKGPRGGGRGPNGWMATHQADLQQANRRQQPAAGAGTLKCSGGSCDSAASLAETRS